MKTIKNKSQIWGIDLMIAVTLFVFGIMIFYIYNLNAPSDVRENFEYMTYDGNLIMDSILSEGYPANWSELVGTADEDKIVKIGVLTNSKINNTKLEKFNDLATGNYDDTKIKFSTRYDYYFTVDADGNLGTDDLDIDGDDNPGNDPKGIGKMTGGNPDIDNARNLIKITRFTIYEDKPMTAYLYVWE